MKQIKTANYKKLARDRQSERYWQGEQSKYINNLDNDESLSIENDNGSTITNNAPEKSLNRLLPCRGDNSKERGFYSYKVKDLVDKFEDKLANVQDVFDFLDNKVPKTYIFNSFDDIVISFSNYLNEKRKSFKKAQVGQNPLDGKSAKQARNIVSKIVPYDKIKGLFSDKDWSGVSQIWKAFNAYALNWQITKSDYYKDHNDPNAQMPVGKRWTFEIDFTNDKGKPMKLYGSVVAAGAGTVQDPLSRYDIVVNLG